ncbi:MAG: ribulokinase [Alistipes sp.]|nr:ribulokinase [Candidatus Alistipes equi]
MKREFVIGLDFGTDSVRAVFVNAQNGEITAESVCEYPRWAERKYCNEAKDEFRHHPLDYIESLKRVIHEVLDSNPGSKELVRGIAVDATGSTPCLVNSELTPLSLLSKYENNPDAMFILWKDHSAAREAEEITAHAEGCLDCVSGCCGPEFYWPKLLHVLRHSPQLKDDAYSFLDLCTWLSNMLTGNHDPNKVKHAQSVVASKFFEDPILRKLPSKEWFAAIDRCWLDVVSNINPKGDNGDEPYGTISKEFAKEFNIAEDVVIAVGMLDGFAGAVGAGISENMPVMTLGTSSGYFTVSKHAVRVKGAFSQGVGQILPGMFSVEMGLSAFGDAYAWLAQLLAYPLKLKGISYSKGEILSALGRDAENIEWSLNLPYATDYFNGRRSPDQNPALRASIMGLRLSSSAPEIYRALVEATCFATRAIIERMNEYMEKPKEVMCIGGISHKSPFVMQMMADVTGVRMNVLQSTQSTALGAAMCAATACGIHPDIYAAQKAMGAAISATYEPDASHKEIIDARYQKYLAG